MKNVLLACALAGCAYYTSKDALDSSFAVRAQAAIQEECADAGPCMPERVRALSHVSQCRESGPLVRHGKPVPGPDAGCRPEQ